MYFTGICVALLWFLVGLLLVVLLDYCVVYALHLVYLALAVLFLVFVLL